MHTIIPFLLLDVLLLSTLTPATAQSDLPQSRAGGFIENKGQWPSEARFLLRLPGVDAWIGSNSITHEMRSPSIGLDSAERVRSIAVRMEFAGGSATPRVLPADTLPGRYNYLIGNDPMKWTTGVRHYRSVLLDELYAGIDVRFVEDAGELRYDVLLSPGADPGLVRLRFDGVDSIRSTSDGELLLHTALGMVRHRNLVAYQEIAGARRRVDCRFAVRRDGTVGFRLGSYDRSRPLVIDPLVYSTFVGGGEYDGLYALAVDSRRQAHIGGHTLSQTFPTTVGAFNRSLTGSYDMVVTKLTSDGSALVYSTYIGGTNWERVDGLAIGRSGECLVVASTSSPDFPTLPGAFDTSFDGGTEVAYLRLDVDGTRLLSSTLLGGADSDQDAALAVDSSGSVYIKGFTTSRDFPTTPGAWEQAFGSGPVPSAQGFLCKMAADGSRVEYATMLTRIRLDGGWYMRDLAVSPDGIAYITAQTSSPLGFYFPAEAYDTTFDASASNSDAFVVAIDRDGSGPLFATYIGGSDHEWGTAIAIASNGDVCIAGSTGSSDFPATPGSDTTSPHGDQDAFVARFDPTLRTLRYSLSIGGTMRESGFDLALDDEDRITVVGTTTSADFPTTPGAYDESYNDIGDAFVTTLALDGSIVSSSFLGGSLADVAERVAFSGGDEIFIAGTTSSADFPVSASPFDNTHNGKEDLFVTTLPKPCTVTLPPLTPATICRGESTTISVSMGAGTPPYSYQWTPSTGLSDSRSDSPIASPDSTTEYRVVVTDASGCIGHGRVVVTVSQPMQLTTTADTAMCAGGSIRLDARVTSGTPPYAYQWSPSIGLDRTDVPDPLAAPAATTAYSVSVTDALGCIVSSSNVTVIVHPLPPKPTIARSGDTLVATVTTGSLAWFHDGRSIDSATSPRLLPKAPGHYAVVIVDANGCVASSEEFFVPPPRTVRLDTAFGRVGEAVRLRLSVSPPILEAENLRSLAVTLKTDPRSLLLLDASMPNAPADIRWTLDTSGTIRVVCTAIGSPFDGETLLYLDFAGSITSSPINLVRIDSIGVDLPQRLTAGGDGLILLEGCDLEVPVKLDRAVTVTKVSPNPSTSEARVRYYAPRGSSPQLFVKSLDGRTLDSRWLPAGAGVEEETVVDVRGLASGVYRFELRDAYERSAITLIVVH